MGSLELDTTERLHFHFSLSCIGEGNGNPLQCSCLENPRDGEAWWAAVSGVAQSRTRLKRLSSSISIFVEASATFSCAVQDLSRHFPVGASSKELLANAGHVRDAGSINRLGREDPLEEGIATHSSILAWRIPWTEEPGRGYSPGGCKEVDVM